MTERERENFLCETYALGSSLRENPDLFVRWRSNDRQEENLSNSDALHESIDLSQYEKRWRICGKRLILRMVSATRQNWSRLTKLFLTISIIQWIIACGKMRRRRSEQFYLFGFFFLSNGFWWNLRLKENRSVFFCCWSSFVLDRKRRERSKKLRKRKWIEILCYVILTA